MAQSHGASKRGASNPHDQSHRVSTQVVSPAHVDLLVAGALVVLTFILREASGVFVGWTVLLTLVSDRCLDSRAAADAASRMDAAPAYARGQRHRVPVRTVPRRHVVQPDAQGDGDPREGTEVPYWAISGPNYAAWVRWSVLGVAWLSCEGK